MRYLAALTVALALLVTAAPVGALTGFSRTITTQCINGKIRANNVHTGSLWTTPQDCVEAIWVPEKQTYMYIYRPWTDFKGGDMAATHWYPGCYHELDSVFGDGPYSMIYNFLCD